MSYTARSLRRSLLMLLLTLPAPLAAVEFVSLDFLSRPGELRAVFQLSGTGFSYSHREPMPGKVLVEVNGLCRSFATPAERTALEAQGYQACSGGRPNASLKRLYRFEKNLPASMLNVVDLGMGSVQLIWRLRSPGIPYRVSGSGDQVEVHIGARGEAPPRASTTPPAQAASRTLPSPAPRAVPPPGPRPERALPPGVTSTPIGKADTRLGPPNPAFLPQSAEYRLGAGDVIEIVVHSDERLDRKLPVAPTGYIDLPLMGSLPVAGRTLAEVEEEIERLLGESYLRDPDVTVLVDEYNSQFVNVIGAVGAPGRVPLKGPTTLMDIVSEVEGTTENASGAIVLYRKGQTEPVRIAIDDVMGGIEGTNPLLRNGDTISVEMKKPFYVSGEVGAPGKYDVEPGMTILDALAVAGGITEYGQKDKAILLRTIDGERREIKVNPKAIERGKEQNIEILSGDHIKVPPKFF